MPIFVRKIDRASWKQPQDESKYADKMDDIPSDAITNCLKTKHNSLSVWQIKDETEIDLVAIAVTCAGKHLETIDLAMLNESDIKHCEIKETDGNTIAAFKRMHRDLVNLSYQKLGIIASFINNYLNHIDENKYIRRYSQGKLKDMIKQAIQNGQVSLDELNPDIKKKIDKS